ncbi:MAG: hypothetical protein JSW51_10775 [Gemmatimonadota bacterium]|nr:MAG: hypothetical protein JSW51_10775 [Gemmatimonadota bacterium]
MNIDSGIDPLDRRLRGIRAGGVYVIAGTPGSGKLTSVLQFLNTGIQTGERVALLAGIPPEQVFEHSDHFGFELAYAWKRDQLRVLGFTDDFESLLLRAADPQDVFKELSGFLGSGVRRVGIDPGKPLWETRAGTTLGNRFIQWAESSGATTWVTLASDLSDTPSPATEWVLQSATGVLKLERLSSGLRQIWIRRISPPSDTKSPITLELVSGKGFQDPVGRLDRRSTDAPIGSERRLALLQLASSLPQEIVCWARTRFEVVEEKQALRLLSRLQDGETFGSILVYLDRPNSRNAVDACRAIRPLTTAPIVLAADDRLRASDRTDALDAGANDFLSDNFSIVELASRLERASQAARGQISHRKALGDEPVPEVAEIMEADSFAQAVDTRLGQSEGSLFTLLILRPPAALSKQLGEILLEQIRGEVGDIVGRTKGGYGVVLQGARPSQAGAFLSRVNRALQKVGQSDRDIDIDVLSGATEADRIAENIPVHAQ